MFLSERLMLIAEETSLIPLSSMSGLRAVLFTFLNPNLADDHDDVSGVISEIESYFRESGYVSAYQAVWVVEPDVSSSITAHICNITAPITHIICDPDGRILDMYTGEFDREKMNYIMGANE